MTNVTVTIPLSPLEWDNIIVALLHRAASQIEASNLTTGAGCTALEELAKLNNDLANKIEEQKYSALKGIT